MTKSKGGAARKAPEGLNVPIYLRGDQSLVDGIDKIVARMNELTLGSTLSRADVIRGILWDAVKLDERTPRDAAHTVVRGRRVGKP